MHSRGSDEQGLDALFRAYRDACPDLEPSANFMPQLWERIEARQSYSFFLGRLTSGFVTAAAAITLAMAVWLYIPRYNAFYSETYVEALSASHSADADLYETSSDPAGQL